jgi:hypothetical protein
MQLRIMRFFPTRRTLFDFAQGQARRKPNCEVPFGISFVYLRGLGGYRFEYG